MPSQWIEKPQLRRISETHLQVKAHHLVKGERDTREPEQDEITSIQFRNQDADNGHADDRGQASTGHGETG
jgi:hypothetical protein